MKDSIAWFLDIEFVRQHVPNLKDSTDDELINYLMTPSLAEIAELGPLPRPNALFDPENYLSRYPDVRLADANPIVHFLINGKTEGRCVDPLFDADFVAGQLNADRDDSDLLAAFLSETRNRVLSIHPLIDVAHLAKQHPEREPKDLCLAFVSGQLPPATTPHPLFDFEYYSVQRGEIFDGCADALRDFLQSPNRPVPIFLFDRAYYASRTRIPDEVDPFVHFALNTEQLYAPVHPACDVDFYLEQLASRNLTTSVHPLVHYVTSGRELDVTPVRSFDVPFYREQAEYAGDDPLKDYFVSGFRFFAPTPAADLGFLSESHADFEAGVTEFLSWFYAKPETSRPSPHPRFSPGSYLRRYEDIRRNGLCPATHFLEWGLKEGRWPNDFFSPSYVQHTLSDHAILGGRVVEAYFRSELSHRPRLLFVSHDASLTGAPAIILRLLEDFSASGLFECCTLLDRPGARMPQFERASHAYVLQDSARQHGWDSPLPKQELDRLFTEFGRAKPVMAFINSAESRHIGQVAGDHELPVVTLIHEAAFYYRPETFLDIYSWSDRVVFPSNYVLGEAERFAFDESGRVIVRGQGLLKDTFGRLKRELIRPAVCKELDIPEESRIVLSCGTLDQRKGVDYFVATARRLLEKYKDLPPTYFVWIGDGARWSNTPFHYANQEAEICGIQSQIRFIGPRTNVEPYFVASDIFLMTARADPFPCVIHEAMASGLPVIGFEHGGGAPELYGKRGKTVPFGDVVAMTEAVASLLGDDTKRKRHAADSRKYIYKSWRSQDYFRFFVGELDRITGSAYAKQLARSKPLDAQVYCLRDLRRHGDGGLITHLHRRLLASGIASTLLSAVNGVETVESFVTSEDDVQHAFVNWFDHSHAAFNGLVRRIDDTSGGVLIVTAAALAHASRFALSPRVGLAVLVTSPAQDHAIVERYWASIQYLIVPSAEAAARLADFNPQFASKTLVAGFLDRTPRSDWPSPPTRVVISLLDTEVPVEEVLRRSLRFIAALRRDRPQTRFTFLGREANSKSVASTAKRVLSGLGSDVAEVATIRTQSEMSTSIQPGDLFLVLGAEEAVPVGIAEAIQNEAFVLVATHRKWLQRKLRQDNTGVGFELQDLEIALKLYLSMIRRDRPVAAPKEAPAETLAPTANGFDAAISKLVALAAEGAIVQAISSEYLQ